MLADRVGYIASKFSKFINLPRFSCNFSVIRLSSALSNIVLAFSYFTIDKIVQIHYYFIDS